MITTYHFAYWRSYLDKVNNELVIRFNGLLKLHVPELLLNRRVCIDWLVGNASVIPKWRHAGPSLSNHDRVLLHVLMLFSDLLLPLEIEVDSIQPCLLRCHSSSYIGMFRGYAVRKLSECNFAISIKIHSSNDGIDIALLDFFLELRKELAYRFEVNVPVSLLVNNSESCDCTKIYLPLECLLLLLYLQVVVYLSTYMRDERTYFSINRDNSYSR